MSSNEIKFSVSMCSLKNNTTIKRENGTVHEILRLNSYGICLSHYEKKLSILFQFLYIFFEKWHIKCDKKEEKFNYLCRFIFLVNNFT